MDSLMKKIHSSERFSFEGACAAVSTAMNKNQINEVERQNLNKFLERDDVKAALIHGKLALDFSRQSGIGVRTTASVAVNEITVVSEDITDYGAW